LLVLAVLALVPQLLGKEFFMLVAVAVALTMAQTILVLGVLVGATEGVLMQMVAHLQLTPLQQLQILEVAVAQGQGILLTLLLVVLAVLAS